MSVNLTESEEKIVNSEHFKLWKEDYVQERDHKKLWDQIGIHRPIGGFWHNFIFQIFIILIPALWVGWLIKFLYPIPEMTGYKDTFKNIFVVVFTLFDLATGGTINRFIADENIKNPREMIKYIQYFIWYQSISGLVQISLISVWIFKFLNSKDLMYGSWIMLVLIIKQWPGFTGAFKGILESLQLYNKTNLISFIQGQGIEMITVIIFVLLGKQWGANNPEIGIVMGVAIGGTFGVYLDDVIAMFIGAHFLKKALAPYGIKFRDFFGVEFDWPLVKRCTAFGFKTGVPGLLGATVGLSSLLLLINYIPQYSSYKSLVTTAFGIVTAVNRLVETNWQSTMIEAYRNDGKNLTQYYTAHSLRFMLINTGFAFSIMLMIYTLLLPVFTYMELDQYMGAIAFFIPALIARVLRPYRGFFSQYLIAGDRADLIGLFSVVTQVIDMLSWWLTLVVFHVQDYPGGIQYILTLTLIPGDIIMFIIVGNFVNRKMFKIKFMKWQSLIVPVMSTTILVSVFMVFKTFVLDPLFDINFYLFISIALIGILFAVIGFYFPLTVFLGGWDRNSLIDFDKAMRMSGASKLFVKPLLFLIKKSAEKSKLHDTHRFDETLAFIDIYKITHIRDENRLNV